MPLTFLSHQAPVVALKLARPRCFDGVALVIGSMAPDFPYVLSETAWEFDAHGPVGLVAFALPASVAVAWLLRARVAAVAFALLPSLGPLRMGDWRVLAARRPAWWVTATSALLGAASHSLWDTFTHDRGAGARLFPVLRERALTLGDAPVSNARVLQYLGHVFGALVTLALLRHIAREGLLARWYGEAFARLPHDAPPASHRALLAGVLAACGAAGVVGGVGANTSGFVLRVAAAMALGLTAVALGLRGHPAYRVSAGPCDPPPGR